MNCEGMRLRQSPRSAPLIVFATAIVLALAARVGLTESPVDLARRAGLRVLEGRHLTLVTDRPPRTDDGVEDLPRLFDEAFAAWCQHAGLDPAAHAEWRALGCLMMDREPFRIAGLLPADGVLPDFANGFCAAGRFWMMDQSSPDYRRHLLLHEGVHAFMLTLRSAAAAPPWYAEGIAEYLATHRLEKDPAGRVHFIATPIPACPSDVEQLGRIEQLHALRDSEHAPLLADVFALPSQAHATLDAYAASWAAVALLANHPAHRAARHRLHTVQPTKRAVTPGRAWPLDDATLRHRDHRGALVRLSRRDRCEIPEGDIIARIAGQPFPRQRLDVGGPAVAPQRLENGIAGHCNLRGLRE